MLFKRLVKYLGLRPTQAIILLCDALVMQAVLLVVVLMRAAWGNITFSLYISMSTILLCAPIFSMLFKTCQVPMPPAHREVKHVFLMVSMSYLVILLHLFMIQESVEYSRFIVIVAWACSVFAVPMVRGFVRRRLCRRAWWGSATIFLQDEERCKEIWDELVNYPERGLRPVAYLSIDYDDEAWKENIKQMHEQYVKPMFIWCGKEGESIEKSKTFEEIILLCKDIIFIPCGAVKKKKFWLAPRLMGTSMGFIVRQNLTDVRRLLIKRCIDLLLSTMSMVVVLPLGLIIAAAIKINTRANVLYAQKRWGQGGKQITIYKFCTMVPNAEEVLKDYLANNSLAREEWEKTQKLVHDPRITPIGKLLRKTSLDELPQLINVMQGSMSLVGPRPIVENEIKKYGDVYLDYTAVKPGITGLWQISGRNLTTYEQRVWYDNFYVTNWSLWMDLWIIARTIPVVLRGHGAF